MSDDRLSQLHQVLKEPLRYKILMQFGKNERLPLDDLIANLSDYSIQELRNQLNILGELMVQGENLLSKQSDLKYELTEKGHYVLDAMLAFPELATDNYKEKLLGSSARKVNRLIFILAFAGILVSVQYFVFLFTGLFNSPFAGVYLLLGFAFFGFIGDLVGKKTNYKGFNNLIRQLP
jgi:hypothetical protein